MRSKDTAYCILEILQDNKMHSMSEIAEKLEVSRRTVVRHFQSLAAIYDISIFKGGQMKGGVRLEVNRKIDTSYLSDDELQVIITQLGLLQDPDDNVIKFIS